MMLAVQINTSCKNMNDKYCHINERFKHFTKQRKTELEQFIHVVEEKLSEISDMQVEFVKHCDEISEENFMLHERVQQLKIDHQFEIAALQFEIEQHIREKEMLIILHRVQMKSMELNCLEIIHDFMRSNILSEQEQPNDNIFSRCTIC